MIKKRLTFKNFIKEQQQRKIIAVVPGAFKPPHAAHCGMVEEYSKIADEVVVIISDPKKESSLRKTPSGKIISPEKSKDIWEIYTKNLGNVKVVISNKPSPVVAAYDYIETLKDVDVILGASKKGDDWKRWKTAPAYFEKKGFPVTIKDPEEYAVDAKFDNMSATDFRNSLQSGIDGIKPFVPEHLSNSDIEKISEILK